VVSHKQKQHLFCLQQTPDDYLYWPALLCWQRSSRYHKALLGMMCSYTDVRKVWNQWEFYLLFIVYIICSICSPRHSTHFLSRFTMFVVILLNIWESTVAQQSVIQDVWH
jgi:hypothetical protein